MTASGAPRRTPPRTSRGVRAVALGALAALLGPAALVLAGPVAPAAAKEAVVERSSDAYLCTGYAGCEAAGYSTSGYRQNSSTMYWQMYAGHNCTNYVAYRMVRAGMPNVRPWSGSGNASNWGVAMADKVDQTPSVGAIAWWRANVPGAGSAGHVAYVEKVVSDSEIIVSEDSWGGDFHWHRYTKSGAWPSGFIHLADRSVTNTERPTITGVEGAAPRAGTTLTATKGTWKPRVDAGYQWLADGRPVAEATERRFTPGRGQLGKRLTVAVTGRRAKYTPATVTTAPTAAVRRGRFDVTAPPVVSGDAVVGQTLTATRPTATPVPGTTEVQWYAAGEPVPGATDWSYTLTEAEQGDRLRAQVTLKAPGFKPRRPRSEATAAVLAPQVEVTEPAEVEGTPLVGETLSVDPGSFSPARAEVRYTWLRDGERVSEVDGPTYDLRPRDVGSMMTVRVDLVREGFRRATQTLALVEPVRTTPSLAVEAEGREHRAVVRLRVRAPGVEAPAGRAVVAVGQRSETVPVVDGLARVVVRQVAAGERSVRVRYLGDELVLPASATTPVVVERGAVAPRTGSRDGTRDGSRERSGERSRDGSRRLDHRSGVVGE